ncbi:hypothetical protein PMAYCL1PPCAC_19724, partial [Pristionchus mayeri]
MQLLLITLLPLFVFSRLSPPEEKQVKLSELRDDYKLVHNVEVESSPSQFSSAAIIDDVTVQFQLLEIMAEEKNQPRANYTVGIINKSKNLLCEVVFEPNV